MSAIETPTDISYLTELSPKILLLERRQTSRDCRRVVDVFSDHWSISVAQHIPPGTVFLHRHGKAIEVSGTIGLFVPPHSILDWELLGSCFSWKALLIESPPPAGAPPEACMVQLKESDIPQHPQELLNLLERFQNSTVVAKEERVTALARDIKKYLDEFSLETFTLQKMAKDLGCSPGSMSRAFRQCYGVTPIYYRNQLRVFRASLMLARGAKVVQVGHEVGFADLGRFNKQFKKKLNAVPKQFIDATR